MIKQAKVLKEYLAPGNLISSEWFLQRRLSCESMFENPRLVPDKASKSGPDRLPAIWRIISGGRLSMSTNWVLDTSAQNRRLRGNGGFPGAHQNALFKKK